MKPISTHRRFLITVLAVALLLCLAVLARAEVTEQDIRDAILGTKTFSQEELGAMDEKGNKDGQVDVADLVKVRLGAEGPASLRRTS